MAPTPKKAKAPAGQQFVKDPKRPGKFKLQPKPKPKRAAVNPLDQAVNSAITSQVSPYEQANANRLTQYEHDTADNKAAGDLLQQNLKGILNTQATANNDALGLAAQRGTASADRMASNMSFLQSVLGNYVGDGGVGLQGASQHAGVQVAADNAGNTRSVYDAGRAAEGNLSQQRGAQVMQQGERSQQLLAKRMEDQRAIQNEIARIRAQAPLLKRQFGREDEEMRIARQDLALRRQGQNASIQQAKDQLDLGYYQTDAGTAAALEGAKVDAGKDAGRYGYGINKKFDDRLAAIQDDVSPPKVRDPATGEVVENPNHRWRATIDRLRNEGLTPGQSLLLATKWLKGRLSIHGDKSPSVIYKLLKSGELGNKFSDAVAKQVFQLAGFDWSQRVAKPKKPTTVRVPGAQTDSAGNMTGRPQGAVTGTDLANG